MIKKTIYHSNFHETRRGRVLNALLAFLTKNRYSILFVFKITIVKRQYTEHSLRKRALEQLYMFLVLLPIVLAIIIFMEGCPRSPILGDEPKEREAQQVDSLHNRNP